MGIWCLPNLHGSGAMAATEQRIDLIENRLNVFSNDVATLASRTDQAVRDLQQHGIAQGDQDKALRAAIDEWTTKQNQLQDQQEP